MEVTCKHCKTLVPEESYFCPNCGKKIKNKPLSTSIGRQILVYLFSALLPPLGLWPAIRYLRQPDKKSKEVGIAAIIITVIVSITTIWLTIGLMDAVNQTLNSFGGDINLY